MSAEEHQILTPTSMAEHLSGMVSGPVETEFIANALTRLRRGIPLGAQQKSKLEEMYESYLEDPEEEVDF